jgi:hypothetical protein
MHERGSAWPFHIPIWKIMTSPPAAICKLSLSILPSSTVEAIYELHYLAVRSGI